MANRHRARRKPEEAEVNMTPMLDIVFILLIFFIVTATFIRESGFDVTKPDDSDQPPPTERRAAVLVQLDKNSDIFIERRRIDVRSVRSAIEAKIAEDPQTVVVVQAHEDANTGTMTSVMDQARLARAPVSVTKLDSAAAQAAGIY